jgi:hypothetical protein
MPDEYLERLERWQRGADEQFERIDRWQHGADERFDRIEAWQHSADDRFDRIEAWQRGADQQFERIGVALGELGRHMRMLHEDVIDRLKDSSERDAVTKAELSEVLATEREKTDRRLDPLEVVVRQHSTDIARLKRPRR